MYLSTVYSPQNRRYTAEGTIRELDIKDSVNQIVEEATRAKEELTKMRADLIAESSMYRRGLSGSGVSESEVMNLVKDLQREVIELNEKIDSANCQIREKEVENFLLKQSIGQIMMIEKNQCPECTCSTF